MLLLYFLCKSIKKFIYLQYVREIINDKVGIADTVIRHYG